MFPTVYLCLVVPLVWGLTAWRRSRESNPSAAREAPNIVLQAAWLGSALAFVAIGGWVISFQDPGAEQGIYRWTGFVLGGAFAVGGTLMGLGLAASRSRWAWRARLIGWLLVALAAFVPSILTLAMPLVALTAFSLRRSGPGRRSAGIRGFA